MRFGATATARFRTLCVDWVREADPSGGFDGPICRADLTAQEEQIGDTGVTNE